jgi:hypothetical protein
MTGAVETFRAVYTALGRPEMAGDRSLQVASAGWWRPGHGGQTPTG